MLPPCLSLTDRLPSRLFLLFTVYPRKSRQSTKFLLFARTAIRKIGRASPKKVPANHFPQRPRQTPALIFTGYGMQYTGHLPLTQAKKYRGLAFFRALPSVFIRFFRAYPIADAPHLPCAFTEPLPKMFAGVHFSGGRKFLPAYLPLPAVHPP